MAEDKLGRKTESRTISPMFFHPPGLTHLTPFFVLKWGLGPYKIILALSNRFLGVGCGWCSAVFSAPLAPPRFKQNVFISLNCSTSPFPHVLLPSAPPKAQVPCQDAPPLDFFSPLILRKPGRSDPSLVSRSLSDSTPQHVYLFKRFDPRPRQPFKVLLFFLVSTTFT